jgi:hypothetical protein
MTRHTPADPIETYLAELQHNLASGIAKENTHRHALQDLLQDIQKRGDKYFSSLSLS